MYSEPKVEWWHKFPSPSEEEKFWIDRWKYEPRPLRAYNSVVIPQLVYVADRRCWAIRIPKHSMSDVVRFDFAHIDGEHCITVDTLSTLQGAWTSHKNKCIWLPLSRAVACLAQVMPDLDPASRAELYKEWFYWGYTLPENTIEAKRMGTRRMFPEGDERPHLYATFAGTDESPDWKFQNCSYTLYSQQVKGAAWMYSMPYCALYYAARTGKTLTAISAVKAMLADDLIDKVIFVCPTPNIIDPWDKVLKDERISRCVLEDTPDEDKKVIEDFFSNHETPTRAMVISYDRLREREEIIEEQMRFWSTLGQRIAFVCDEAQAFFNPESGRAKALINLARYACRRYIMTGTPQNGGVQDYYSQIRFLDKFNQAIFGSFDRFKREIEEGDLDLRTLIAQISMRVVAGESDQFDGKDKTFRYVNVPPTKEQIEAAKLAAEAIVEIGGEKKKMSECVLAMIAHMRQICAGVNKLPVTGWEYMGSEAELSANSSLKYREYPLKIQPKVMWIRSHLRAYPSIPLVILTNFRDEMFSILEMLQEEGIEYACAYRNVRRVKCFKPLSGYIPGDLIDSYEVEAIKHGHYGSATVMRKFAHIEAFKTHWSDAWFERNIPGSGRYFDVPMADKVGQRELANQRERFQNGEVNVYVLHFSGAAGITLNRQPALRNGIGEPPSIVMASPNWSLAMHLQALDRCLGSDESGKTTHIMVHALMTGRPNAGTIEQSIIGALRSKRDASEAIMEDSLRAASFEDFVSDMISSLTMGDISGEDCFDYSAHIARDTLNIGPERRLTLKILSVKAVQALRARGYAVSANTLDSFCATYENDITEAYRLLRGLIE